MPMADESSKAYRARNLRYKRAALASMGFDHIRDELDEMRDSMAAIHWWSEQDEETLLNTLDGDEDDAWEFKMAFSNLEAKADRLFEVIYDLARYEEDFGQTFDDCTVALIGNRYQVMGFDTYEEDYFNLTNYESGLAQTESGKRLMRKTKAEIIATVGQCLGILISFLDLRQQYDYLKATFDILRDQNTSMLQQIKEIEKAYLEMVTVDAFGDHNREAEKRLDQLLAALPDRAWIE